MRRMLQFIAKILAFSFFCLSSVFASSPLNDETSEAILSSDTTNLLSTPFENSDNIKTNGSIFDNLDKKEVEQIEKQKTGGDFYNTAIFKVIDKRLGKMDILEVNVTNPMLYNDELIVRVLSCWKETEKKLLPDSKALVEFYTISPLKSLEKKFGGWIFSKNPGISTYNNEKYEFLLSSCKNNSDSHNTSKVDSNM